MNTLWIVILSVLTIYLAYNLYAKRIDRNVGAWPSWITISTAVEPSQRTVVR